MIQFILNDQLVSVDNISPNTTVLDYVRQHQALTGTKEGCASGDCGACTVVVGQLIDGELHYQSLNACITFVGTLQGKHLITVEHLQQGQQLHPVQQAMVDHNGSQCGFCTPGIVMSLAAFVDDLQRADVTTAAESPDREDIAIALSGNLCRCTGYNPIYKAAEALLSQPSIDDTFRQRSMNVAQQLVALNQQTADSTDCPAIRYQTQEGTQLFFAPRTLEELTDLYAQYPSARLVKGGTDLALEVTQQLKTLEILIYTGLVQELNRLSIRGNSLVIGAAMSYTQCLPAIRSTLPAFADVIDRIGSLQIRNQATFAGNIANASPIGDTPPALLALNAELHLRSQHGSRVVNINDFFTGYRETVMQPGEFIEQTTIPLLTDEQQFHMHKVSKRLEDDISAVCFAMTVTTDQDTVKQVSVAFGGMAATPKRAVTLEKALIGQPWTEDTILATMDTIDQDFNPLSDVRASEHYRRQVAKNLLLRVFHESSTPAYMTQVHHA